MVEEGLEGPNGPEQHFSPDENLLGQMAYAGFARFCNFKPDRVRFYEGFVNDRITMEYHRQLKADFARDCGVRLNRLRPKVWRVTYPRHRSQRESDLIRTIKAHGVEVTINGLRSVPSA